MGAIGSCTTLLHATGLEIWKTLGQGSPRLDHDHGANEMNSQKVNKTTNER